jgi:hypothetical protein
MSNKKTVMGARGGRNGAQRLSLGLLKYNYYFITNNCILFDVYILPQ